MANYLYNGVELPALPEWDKTKYPFVLITQTESSGQPDYNLWFADAKTMKKSDGIYWESVPVTFVSGGRYYAGVIENWKPAWDYPQTKTDNSKKWSSKDILWSNYDILNDDGTLYLSATDPIPVGTAPVIDPLSLFLGWKAGNWVARQRGKA